MTGSSTATKESKRPPVELAALLLGLMLPSVCARSATYNAAAQRGRNALRAHNAVAAREAFRQASELATHPGLKAEALLGIGAAYEVERDYVRARQAYARARALPGVKKLPWVLVKAQWQVAMTYHKEGQHAEAVEELTRIHKMEAVTPQYASDAWLYMGLNQKECGRYEEAITAFRRVLATAGNPRFHRSRALLEIGESHYRARDLTAALSAYRQVAELKGRGVPIRHRSLARHEIERIQQEWQSSK